MPGDSPSPDEFLEEKSTAFLDFIYGKRINIILILMGLIFLGSGVLLYKNTQKVSDIEIVESVNQESEKNQIIVEIVGAIENSGVYKFTQDSRVEDLLIKSGGLSADADRVWVEKYVNRAAKLIDGQKFYIPSQNEQSQSTSANCPNGDSSDVLGELEVKNQLVNINIASQAELELLSGIGPVYAQNIIEHRPYSSVEDLFTKGALKNSVYEKIKDKVRVY